MRIAVVGVGGVGGYFGGKLAQAGEDVVFMARGEHLNAIREAGLRVESADGDFTIHPAQATDDPTTVGLVDMTLLAVKGWQVPQAIETMRPLIGPETFVTPLLNGVDAPDQLVEAFGQRRVIGGLCGLFGAIAGPGLIRNMMPRPFITIGELDNTRSERVERLYQALAQTGVQATIAKDIQAAMWEKLLLVGPFGGIGAITRAPIGVFRAQPESRALLEAAMAEIQAVAQARGVQVADGAIARALAMVDSSPAQATASMHRDTMAGRPSELESQIGVIVRMARAADVAAPIHTFLYASLLPQERQARGEITFPG